ncbi:carbohydrate-binding module family 1 protein [Saccharata proteae CBS 121410]|uniref:AA9 family lytic polysaccharide monooxygenase n=1 Tax=Saccharata proteae CBS 121410 TaxID=1314787 RepID=A0A9P4LYK8_9PEZI|nr:carbohydrate-binding module family 1 protein [Saccharata proteae CBS 121410]
MKTTALLALAAAAKLAHAHTTVYAIWVNDVDQGLGNSDSGYIRSPPNNNPVKDVTSTDMTCNVNNVATAKTIEVEAGDKITFEWHHNSRDSSDDILASSHLGPVMTYIAPTDAGTSGTNWVKLAEDGYSDGTWATTTLIANKGKHSITMPDITPGNYLLRPEIIALHEAENEGGAQFYMECVQIKVTSSGTTDLPTGVDMPGTYSATDPGILFNLYGDFSTYDIPGPTVWSGASSGSSATTAASVATSAAASSAATSVEAATTEVATSVAPVTSAVATSSTSTPVVATTLVTSVKAASSAAAATTSAAAAVGAIAVYQQCGGLNYSGATTCADGLTCKQWNPYYHQCIASS